MSIRRALIAVLVLLLSTAGCAGSKTGNEDAVLANGEVDLSQVTLQIGDQRGGAQALLSAAGLIDTPYQIDFKQFTSGPPLLEALNAGSIHAGSVGNTPPIFAAAAKGTFKVVQAASYGGAGDAILVPKDSPIKTVADLNGASIAVARGSSANYHLLAQLEAAGLGYDAIKPQDLQPPDALSAFSAGHIDAWATWEPYTSAAVETAGARVLADGADITNGYQFVVASDDAIADPATRAALSDYLSRITQAQQWSQTHKPAWAKAWAESTGLTLANTTAAVGNRTVTTVPIDDQVIASEQDMTDAFVQVGLLPESLDIAGFFDDEFNDELGLAPHPSP